MPPKTAPLAETQDPESARWLPSCREEWMGGGLVTPPGDAGALCSRVQDLQGGQEIKQDGPWLCGSVGRPLLGTGEPRSPPCCQDCLFIVC